MSNEGSDKEREFLIAGAKTYLDVDDAMAEFRRRIQDQCTTLVTRRLDEINRACDMDWTANDLKDYKWRESDYFHVGKQLPAESLGGLYFCLDLYRDKGSLVYGTLVYLYRRRASLAVGLWDRLDGAASDTAYCEGNSLIFERLLSEGQIPNFLEQLNRALDDFITFIGGCGGLKKYMPQEP